MNLKKRFSDWLNGGTVEEIVTEATGYKVTELPVLSEDGKTHCPDAVYIAKGAWSRAAELNGEKFHQATSGRYRKYLPEGVSGEQYGLKDYRGGVIVFSTDVNAVGAKSDGTRLGTLKAFLKNKYDTLVNRALKNKKLANLIQKHNSERPEDLFIGAFSIGKFFYGRYVSGGKVFDETSTSIEIAGVPSEVLLFLGTEIAKEFKQETVLVKDYNKNKFYLADGSDVSDATSELKKV